MSAVCNHMDPTWFLWNWVSHASNTWFLNQPYGNAFLPQNATFNTYIYENIIFLRTYCTFSRWRFIYFEEAHPLSSKKIVQILTGDMTVWLWLKDFDSVIIDLLFFEMVGPPSSLFWCHAKIFKASYFCKACLCTWFAPISKLQIFWKLIEHATEIHQALYGRVSIISDW